MPDDRYLYLAIAVLLFAVFLRYDPTRGLYLDLAFTSPLLDENWKTVTMQNLFDSDVTIYKLSASRNESDEERGIEIVRTLKSKQMFQIKTEVGSIYIADIDKSFGNRSSPTTLLNESVLFNSSVISLSTKAIISKSLDSYYFYPLQRIPAPRTAQVEYRFNINKRGSLPEQVVLMNKPEPRAINVKFR